VDSFYTYVNELGQPIVGKVSVMLADNFRGVSQYSDPHRGTGSSIRYIPAMTTGPQVMTNYWYMANSTTFGGQDTCTYLGGSHILNNSCLLGSPIPPNDDSTSSDKKSNIAIIVAATVIPIFIAIVVIVYCLVFRKTKPKEDTLLSNDYEFQKN